MNARSRVLVIDDNPGDLTLLREAICDSYVALELITCSTAPEALDLLGRDHDFALILSDINMPKMTGIDFLHALARMPAASTVPVVLMSSSTRDAMPLSVHGELARVPYFTKPSDWRGFVALAHTLVDVVTHCGTSEDAGEALGAQVRPSARLSALLARAREPHEA